MAVYLGSLELVCFWLVIWAELSTPSQMSLLCNFTVVITCPEVKALWHNRSGSAPHPLLVSSKLSTLDLVSLLFCTSKQNERVTIDKGFSSLMASGSRWWMGPGVDCGEFQSIYYSQYLPFIGTAHLGLLWPDFLWHSRKPGVCMKLMRLNFWQQIQNLIKIAWAKQSTSARQITSRDLECVISRGDYQLASYRRKKSWAPACDPESALCCWQGLCASQLPGEELRALPALALCTAF